MRSSTTRLAVLALIAALAAVVTGCGSTVAATPAATTPATTGTVAPTSTTSATQAAPAAPAASVPGPITSPATGSASRAAILQAVSKGLGVSGNLTVYQLFTDSAAAVGDVQASSGPRTFFALTGGPGAWKLAWRAPFGSSLADAKGLASSVPGIAATLAGTLDFKKVVKKPAAAPAPSVTSFKTFALKTTRTFAASTYTGAFTVTAKIAKDSRGVWWGNAISEPATSGLEPIGVWGTYSAGRWTGEIADFATGGADAAFFPADVLPKLAL